MKWMLVSLCCYASLLLANEDKKTLVDIFVDKKDNTEEKRYTGFTCGTTEYTDWPCIEGDGCIVIEKKESYEIFLNN